jgi:hypothetical protein
MRHPEYYLGRADETRVIADATVNPSARDSLIKIAAEYEDLAKLATTQKTEQLAKVVKSKEPVVVRRLH